MQQHYMLLFPQSHNFIVRILLRFAERMVQGFGESLV